MDQSSRPGEATAMVDLGQTIPTHKPSNHKRCIQVGKVLDLDDFAQQLVAAPRLAASAVTREQIKFACTDGFDEDEATPRMLNLRRRKRKHVDLIKKMRQLELTDKTCSGYEVPLRPDMLATSAVRRTDGSIKPRDHCFKEQELGPFPSSYLCSRSDYDFRSSPRGACPALRPPPENVRRDRTGISFTYSRPYRTMESREPGPRDFILRPIAGCRQETPSRYDHMEVDPDMELGTA